MKSITRPLRQLALFWRASWWLCLLEVGVILLGPLALVSSMRQSGRLIDEVVRHAPFATVMGDAGRLAAYLLGLAVLGSLQKVVAAYSTERVSAEVDALVADTALAPHGIGHLEQGEVVTALRGINDDLHGPFSTMAVQGTWQVYAMRLQALGAFVLVATWSPWLALLVAGAQALTAQVFGGYVRTLTNGIFGPAASDKARELAFRNLTTTREAAKEVRLFGLAPWALGRSHTLWREFVGREWPTRDAAVRRTLLAELVLVAAYGVAFALLSSALWRGDFSAGRGLVLLEALAGLELFGNLGDWQTFAVRHQSQLEGLDELRRGLGLGGILARRAALPEATIGSGRPAGIELRDVCFAYPTREEPIFRDLTLRVPPGQSVAVVGVNGAGKSTLIKLLAGLYPPDAGSVRIDGEDPARDDGVRRRVAVIFQDFTRYPTGVRDNVALALPGTAEQRESVVARALDRAAARSVLERVGDPDRLLSSEYEGGTDLSGGQWQRLALARALAAVESGAGVLVLDEPTAALDVRAEAELFDRFLAMTRGITTVLVSHRLSSVRHADRIVVIDDGSVVEDGTHEQLLAQGGRYADAFTLQAARFAAAGEDAGAAAWPAGSDASPVALRNTAGDGRG